MNAKLLKDEAQFIIEVVKKICTTVGPGIPCSPQERARAMIIKEEMEKTVGPESVDVEEFTCAPSAFLGWIRFGAIAGAVSVGLHFLARQTTGYLTILLLALSFLFALSILLAFLFQFILCREFLDFLFPKKTSVNVIGRIPSKEGKVKKILIFAGHHDSAYQFTWVRYLKYGYFLQKRLAVSRQRLGEMLRALPPQKGHFTTLPSKPGVPDPGSCTVDSFFASNRSRQQLNPPGRSTLRCFSTGSAPPGICPCRTRGARSGITGWLTPRKRPLNALPSGMGHTFWPQQAWREILWIIKAFPDCPLTWHAYGKILKTARMVYSAIKNLTE